jgi:hypothetical protein
VRRYLIEELEIPRTIESKLSPLSIKRIATDFHVNEREARSCLLRLTSFGWVTIRPVQSKSVAGFDWYITKRAIVDAVNRWPWLRDGVRIVLPSVTSEPLTLVGTRVEVSGPGISNAFRRQAYLLPLLGLFFVQPRWRLRDLVTALGRLSNAELITKLRATRAERPHQKLVNKALEFLHSRMLTLYRSRTKNGLEFELVGRPTRPPIISSVVQVHDNRIEVSFWKRFGEVACQWRDRSLALLESSLEMETLVRELRALGEEPSRDSILAFTVKWRRIFV